MVFHMYSMPFFCCVVMLKEDIYLAKPVFSVGKSS